MCSLEAVSRSSRVCTFCEHVHEDGVPEHDAVDDADVAMYGLTDGCCKASSVLERTGGGQNVVPSSGSQQQVSDQTHSCVSPPDPPRLPDHVVHTCQSGGEAQRARGGPSSVLDSTPTQEPFERVPSGGEVRRSQDAAAEGDSCHWRLSRFASWLQEVELGTLESDPELMEDKMEKLGADPKDRRQQGRVSFPARERAS